MPTAAPYTVVGSPQPDRARIRFTGSFEGRPVVWDAEVIALRAGRNDSSPRPYIDVGTRGEHGRALRVGLALTALDAPALAKTVIMIRNYKRLRRGRMEFGDATVQAITKIISGGQTGVDRAALDAAAARGIASGGFCPKGRRAEDGSIPPHYPLTELASADYPTRTRRNVHAADATLVLTRGRVSGGTAYTVQVAQRAHKPVLVVDLAAQPRVAPVRAWLHDHGVRALNVAGPRETRAPGIHRDAKRFLLRLLVPRTRPASTSRHHASRATS